MPRHPHETCGARDGIAALCALDRRPRVTWRDPWVLTGLIGAPLFWACLWSLSRGHPVASGALSPGVLLSVILWQPIVEELCFRGVIQGLLLARTQARSLVRPLTLANAITSLFFGSAHLLTHPWFWTLGIFAVSLYLGLIRDGTDSLYPTIGFHIYFNAGYFLLARI